MNGDLDSSESSSGRFLQTVRPLRDLESNWTVDLAKNLEEYLLKVCSGQISGEDAKLSVNFAEAALLLQGSVQVYSRKVEYLYSLVLHALDFISKKSEEDQEAGPSDRRNSTGAHSAKEEGDDPFWGLDDIPVDAKSLLDNATCRDVPPSHFVRPPANIVVLEGECLDAGGDAGGELESYLLATCDLYRDFILLDSCDAIAVDNFLDSKAGKGPSNVYGISSVTSKGRKSFQSPSRRSGGTAQKLSAKKKNDANPFQSPCVDKRFESNDCNIGHTPPACDFANHDDGFGTGDAYSEPGDFDDSDDDNDPWKPLNPHEPGNLKVKPYKKVKGKTRLNVGSQKHPSLTAEFPLAKLDSLVNPELNEIWGAKLHASENLGRSESLTLYEKLRQSLVMVMGEKRRKDTCNPENNTEDNGYEGNGYEDNGYESGDPDTGPSFFDMPDKTFNHEDEPPHQEKENPDAHANLEDLCRSHLDSLLETLAENEKQTELATRVSSWKQRIEQNLEEQDARPPFDIHVYGERVLDKLSTEGYGGNALSFGDVVKGQKKHDVARTFSALLQLVNNGDVDLVRGSQASASTCHTDENPFHLRLLKNERKKGILLQSCKKRAKSPLVKNKAKVKNKGKENCVVPDSSPQAQGYSSSYRFSISIGKSNSARCTPEGKKRRKSRVVAPLDINFVG